MWNKDEIRGKADQAKGKAKENIGKMIQQAIDEIQ